MDFKSKHTHTHTYHHLSTYFFTISAFFFIPSFFREGIFQLPLGTPPDLEVQNHGLHRAVACLEAWFFATVPAVNFSFGDQLDI